MSSHTTLGSRGPSDELLLFERHRAAPSQATREALVERFLPLALHLARRYPAGGEAEDLRQVASLGLLKAIDRYDPARGIAFSSFAVPTILGELKRHFRDHGWPVRPPREVQEPSNLRRRTSSGGHATASVPGSPRTPAAAIVRHGACGLFDLDREPRANPPSSGPSYCSPPAGRA